VPLRNSGNGARSPDNVHSGPGGVSLPKSWPDKVRIAIFSANLLFNDVEISVMLTAKTRGCFKVWVATQTRATKGQKWVAPRRSKSRLNVFKRYHCLFVSICSVETRGNSRLLTLKISLATLCQKSSIQSLFFSVLTCAVWKQRFARCSSISVALEKVWNPPLLYGDE